MARLTQRDLEIARFLGRTKIARPAQVATRFDVSLATAYARLAFLVETPEKHVVAHEQWDEHGRHRYDTRNRPPPAENLHRRSPT